MKNVKLDGAFFLRWIKRIVVYLLGLYCMAIGVVFSASSSLGVSPVGSLANVLYQIGLNAGWNELAWGSFVTLGNFTILVYCLYILTEFIILRKEFKATMLLQLAASFLFGKLVDIATAMMAFLPTPPNYFVQMIYLLCSVPMVAVGVMLYLSPNILPTPGEGMSLAISKKTGLSVGSSKTIFDCSLVVISAATSLVYFHGLVGVREGTVICALLVGFVMRQMQKVCQKPLLKFVERESKVNRALEEAGGYLTDVTGKPKIIIAIGREAGSGGYDIGRLLAKRLGVTFYDRQINEQAAEMTGMSLKQIEKMESHMRREISYEFEASAYSMHHDALTPEEQLFVAQTAIIRKIAASGESCVIMGRCADWVLYDDPNCFRVFIHSKPEARIDRTMKLYGIDHDAAVKQVNNTDESRARHYRHFTGRIYGQQQYYHLGLDSGMLGVVESAKMILDTIKSWCEVRGTLPLNILPDDDEAEATK